MSDVWRALVLFLAKTLFSTGLFLKDVISWWRSSDSAYISNLFGFGVWVLGLLVIMGVL